MLTLTPAPRLQIAANPLLPGSRVETVDVEEIAAACTLVRSKRSMRRELRDLRAKQTARQAIEGLTPETEIYGFTKGQFSMLQLLEAVIEITGPVHFVLSTWTAARHEIQRLQELGEKGLLKSTRWLVDFTFARRYPAAANQIRLASRACYAFQMRVW